MLRIFLVSLLVASTFASSLLNCAAEETNADNKSAQELRDQEEGAILKKYLDEKRPRFEIIGELQATGGSDYTVNGEAIRFSDHVRIYGEPRNGAQATVSGFIVDNVKQAWVVTVVDHKPATLEGRVGGLDGAVVDSGNNSK